MRGFEKKVLAFIKDEHLINRGDRLLVACSGGVDSMALLHFFDRNKEVLHIELYAVHVDHMLRGEQSAGDRKFVEAFCAARNIPCFSTGVPIPAILKEQGGNSQAVCRQERYAYFASVMKEHDIRKLVTAHHADDQLESILMALAKAGSVTGMMGIQVNRPFENGHVIRPFLMVTKEEIREYLKKGSIDYREDASNERDDYTRNRFRHHIVPLLKAENAAAAQHAVQLSLQVAQDQAYLQGLAQQAFDRLVIKKAENCYEVEIHPFINEPLALQRRLILILLNYLYNDTSTFQRHALCTSILNLFQTQNGNAMLNLPDSFRVSRQYGKVLFHQEQEKVPFFPCELTVNEWNEMMDVRVYIGEPSQMTALQSDEAQVFYCSAEKVSFPLRVRTREEGDRIQLPGMTMPKRLSRLFIDEKVPLAKRDEWPLLVDVHNDILAVLGLRVSNKFSRTRRVDDDWVFIIDRNEAGTFEQSRGGINDDSE